ncbi:hypothetical protein Hanom_Chr16g01422961 [Helianthus anomalus]
MPERQLRESYGVSSLITHDVKILNLREKQNRMNEPALGFSLNDHFLTILLLYNVMITFSIQEYVSLLPVFF